MQASSSLLSMVFNDVCIVNASRLVLFLHKVVDSILPYQLGSRNQD